MSGAPAFFDAAAVRRLLDMPGCIAAVREAMAALSREGVAQPLREIVPVATGKLFGLMPGLLHQGEGYGAKIVSVYADPAQPGRTAHRGLVILFDDVTGEVACLGDAGEITHIRTAAATAVATDALAPPEARRLGIFGCGAQARSHITAIPLVRDIEEVLVWGRDPARAEAFVAELANETRVPVRAVVDPREAAATDIVCTVTGSATPVLFNEWVRPGTHVNLVGSSHAGPVEVDSALVMRGRYIADSRRSALAAASEFLVAREAGLIDDGHIVGEIGGVLIGRVQGRTDADELTIYKSLGHIVQDLAALRYCQSRARDTAHL